MRSWIRELAAFVHDDKDHDVGTRVIDEYKTATPSAEIRVTKDERWTELLELADVFSGSV